jgi:hypothetical protein
MHIQSLSKRESLRNKEIHPQVFPASAWALRIPDRRASSTTAVFQALSYVPSVPPCLLRYQAEVKEQLRKTRRRQKLDITPESVRLASWQAPPLCSSIARTDCLLTSQMALSSTWSVSSLRTLSINVIGSLSRRRAEWFPACDCTWAVKVRQRHALVSISSLLERV